MTFWAIFNIWLTLAVGIAVMLNAGSIRMSGFTGLAVSTMAALMLVASLFTCGLVKRAHWILVMQSHYPDFDLEEDWWRRLIRQLPRTPGQNALDTFMLKCYAYWPWAVICLLVRLRRLLTGSVSTR